MSLKPICNSCYNKCGWNLNDIETNITITGGRNKCRCHCNHHKAVISAYNEKVKI